MQPQLLSQMNERRVLRVLQSTGPCSRADVTRHLGVTAPTVSKAVSALLECGLLEEFEGHSNARGRPAKRLRLASESSQVLGLVIDAGQCSVVAAGLDGKHRPEKQLDFDTPQTYAELLDATADRVEQLRQRMPQRRTLGLGISMPGLIDAREQRGRLSPNVPLTDGHRVAVDIGERTGLPAVLMQECQALCMAERHLGGLDAPDEFAMLDATTGVGLSVYSRDRVLLGATGLAGELGHLPIDPQGPLCGCGRRGCLETLASDASLSRRVSERLGRTVQMGDLIASGERGEIEFSAELAQTIDHLALGLAMVINLYNPTTVFVCSRMFELQEGLLDQLVERTGEHALRPSFEDCQIRQARRSKCEGAIAAIIEHLMDSRVHAEALLGNGAGI